MRCLTEQNDPFTKEFETPEFLRNLMEEYNLDFDMFTEAYGDPAEDPIQYMHQLLYEFEVFRNSLFDQFLNEQAAYYLFLKEQDVAPNAPQAQQATANANESKAGFFAKMKGATAKIAAGIANFFKRAFATVRDKVNKQKMASFIQGLSQADQNRLIKAAEFYTAEEIEERERIYAERLKVYEGLLTSINASTDSATVNKLYNQINQVSAEYDKKLEEFETRHVQKVQAGLKIGDLQKAMSLYVNKNPSENTLTQAQNVSNNTVKVIEAKIADAEKLLAQAQQAQATGGQQQGANAPNEEIIKALQALIAALSKASAQSFSADQKNITIIIKTGASVTGGGAQQQPAGQPKPADASIPASAQL